MDKDQLIEIANTDMPFGKYKGRRLIDVPEEYLLWFARKDQFPAGHLGELMALTLLIKTEGLTQLVQPLKKTSLSLRGAGFLLRQPCFSLPFIASCQNGAYHQLNLMEDH